MESNLVYWNINRFGHVEMKKENEDMYIQTDTEVEDFLSTIGSKESSGSFDDNDYGYFG